jgi:hypothetical protein
MRYGYPAGPVAINFPDGSRISATYDKGIPAGAVLHDGSGDHPMCVTGDGRIVTPEQAARESRSASSPSSGETSHGNAARDHEHFDVGHSVPDNHWTKDGKDMGETHMGDIHPN